MNCWPHDKFGKLLNGDMRLCHAILCAVMSFVGFDAAAQAKPVLRAEILLALRAPTNVVLYSLIPDYAFAAPGENGYLRGYPVKGSTLLGKEAANAAIDSIRPTILNWEDSIDHCDFQPRHALRVTANEQTFDILLCYHCGDIAIYRGNNTKAPKEPIAYFRLLGSADVLTRLLMEAHIAVAEDRNIYADMYERNKQRAKREKAFHIVTRLVFWASLILMIIAITAKIWARFAGPTPRTG